MDQIRKKSGFGCMRLPMKEEEVNTGEFCTMVDTFLKQGFNCFDTGFSTVGKSKIFKCAHKQRFFYVKREIFM